MRISLSADGVDGPVLRRRALGRGRPARADAKRRGARHQEAAAVRRNHAEAFDLADDRVVDRWRLGALFQRCADPGAAAGHVPGADAGLYLDRNLDGDDLPSGRVHARTGVRLHVSVAAHSGGADRRMGAQRHLQIRPRRSTHLAEEGQRFARARPERRGLHRLPSMRRGVPDRHRYPRWRATRLHPVRPVYRCLRHRDEEDRPGNPPDRIRQRHQHSAPPGGKAGNLPPGPAAHHRLLAS